MTKPVRTKQDVLDVLRAHEAELRAIGIEHLDLFGSFARDEAGPKSDVDLHAMFTRGASMAASKLFPRQYALSEMLGRRVDLLSGPFGNAYFYRAFNRDAVNVF